MSIEIVFKSSNSSTPLRLLSEPEQNQMISCGYVEGDRIFETKVRLIGKMYETQWFTFPSQFLFSIVTSPSPVQNLSLVYNKVALYKKMQLTVSWNPPLHHGGVKISSYIVRVLLLNGTILKASENEDCVICSTMWLLDEAEAESRCTVEIISTNLRGKQSVSSARCIDAAHTETPVAPIIALSPGGTHTANLLNMSASVGLWSPAQGFSVFDIFYPCNLLHVSYTTEGRFENIQEVQIRHVAQEDSAWCAHEISVLASQHGDCSDVLVCH
jgi:hypothetical protein